MGLVDRVPWGTIGHLAALALALGFVFSVAYIPHLDTFNNPPSMVTEDGDDYRGDEPAGLIQLADAWWEYATDQREGYPYTTHVDENRHWVQIAGVQRTDQAIIDFPTGEERETGSVASLREMVHERGYHVLVAQAQELTGVGFYRIHQLLPAFWTAFTAFALYAALRPSPIAIPAAALVGLIPTTPRFLGVGFLVPIGFSLAWLPITLILAEQSKKRAGAAILLLVTITWAFFVHLIAGFASIALVVAGALFGTRGQRDRASMLALISLAFIPLLWIYESFTRSVQTEVAREEVLPIDFTVFDGFGLIALALWGFGLVVMALDPPKRARLPVIACAAFSLAALSSIIGSVVFDLGKYAFYARWHPPFFLTASVPAAYGIHKLGQRGLQAGERLWSKLRSRDPGPIWTRVGRPASYVLFAAGLLTVAVSPAVANHVKEPYYHVLEDEDWERYNWIEANLGDEYEVFLTEPWEAPILAAKTGMDPYAFLQPGHPPVNGEDYQRFRNNETDTAFYIFNDITLVVDEQAPTQRLFEEKRPGVHGTDSELARTLKGIRAQETARR